MAEAARKVAKMRRAVSPPEDESKAEAFTRVAGRRMGVALKMIRLVGNCANRATYEYTEEQIGKMFEALADELQVVRTRFMVTAKGEPTGFKF